MTFNFAKKAVVSAAVVLLAINSVEARAEEFTRDDIKQIVKEYIKEHPDEVLQAIVDKSKDDLKKKQDEALTKYKDQIFHDKNSPEAGNPKGDVTVVEFVDYNCGYCKKSAESTAAVMATDKNVRFVFKELPILGDSSKEAAKWALAANMQGKYPQFHSALMMNRTPLSTEVLTMLADQAGLDVEKVKKDIGSDLIAKQIETDYNLAVSMGLTGTPVFVVGDQMVQGALMDGKLEEAIAAQRAKNKK